MCVNRILFTRPLRPFVPIILFCHAPPGLPSQWEVCFPVCLANKADWDDFTSERFSKPLPSYWLDLVMDMDILAYWSFVTSGWPGTSVNPGVRKTLQSTKWRRLSMGCSMALCILNRVFFQMTQQRSSVQLGFLISA